MIDFNKKRIFIGGAGGFIGGHLTKKLINLGANVVAVDIKPLDLWFQRFDEAKNLSLDLKLVHNCEESLKNCE